MDFRTFATNYLNPIFLLYRAVLLTMSFLILFISLSIGVNSVSSNDMMVVFTISLALTVGFYIVFRRRALLLYFVIPAVLTVTSLSIRAEDTLTFSMAMLWISAFLIAFNGFRSWGYGISINDINKKIK